MKIYNKIIASLMLPALGLALASCDDKNINSDYKPEQMTGNFVWFSQDTPTTVEVSEDANYVQIPVYRGTTQGALTVSVDVLAMDNYNSSPYNFDSSVTFADGSNVGYIKVNYDPTKLEYDEEEEYELSLDETYATPYGLSTQVFTLVWPAPWTALGTGYYYDDMFGDGTLPYGVETTFYQNDLYPNKFRIPNPYYPINGLETYFEFEILQQGEVINGTPVTLNDLVYFNPIVVTYIESFEGDIYLLWPGDLEGFEAESNWTSNYVAAYQAPDENGKSIPGEIRLAPIYIALDSGYWAGDTSHENNVRLIFPGYEPKDTSLSLEYVGILTNSSTNVLANIEMGSDLASVKVGVASGTNTSNIVDGITAGTVNSVEVTTGGQVQVPFNSASPMGRYSVVAVGYDSAGKVQSTASAVFSYAGGNNDDSAWKTLGYTNYTEAFICALYTTGSYTYMLELQENTNKPGYYRLVNPYGMAYPLAAYMNYESSETTYLYIDAQNPDYVNILESPQTIMVDPAFGTITCAGLVDFFLGGGNSVEQIYEAGYYGTMEDGVITFNPGALAIYEGADGPYRANYVVNSDGSDYEINASGTAYLAPFYVDVNNVIAAASVVSSEPVAMANPFATQKLSRKPFAAYKVLDINKPYGKLSGRAQKGDFHKK